MPKKFIDKNFLLETKTAQSLYKAAKDEPIYDYHCHLSAAQIAENYQLKNLTNAWLSGDHYKWRMMRWAGIDEALITGNAQQSTHYDKFLAWAKTAEKLIGNPLYHWTHLELQRCFGITKPLTEKSAPEIWEMANTALKTPELSVKGIFEKFKVYAVGTTDDPIDNLEHHRSISKGTAAIGKIETIVFPTFRPDKALEINADGFASYIEELSAASGISIKKTCDILAALENRLELFISLGCLSADHGLEYVPYQEMKISEIDKIFSQALAAKKVSAQEADAFKTYLLTELAHLYAKNNIVMQLHFNVIRNINKNAFNNLGHNTGYDAVNDQNISYNLSKLLNLMEGTESESNLPKTILYSLNPRDYYPIATIIGGFQRAGTAGKIQLGSAWWFCDNRDGMEEHLRVLANLGILSSFIGMLTDSRSFLSYPRHEYFRRILCNLLGKWVENGEYPFDLPYLEKVVKDISFGNAFNYFK